MITVEKTLISDVLIIKNFAAQDERGIFVKTFNKEVFAQNGLETKFVESYYSSSLKNVIRGMHFQIPPHDHNKLVYVTEGIILDVTLDLRKNSETFGNYIAVHLSEFTDSIYIPKGCAHGFLTLSEKATIVYNVSTIYNPKADAGIKWNSFGFDWFNTPNPILSERDNNFVDFKDFNSDF